MKVSRSKTEYLCINGGNDDETVKMEDAKVPRVKKFKYLDQRCKKVVVVGGGKEKSGGRMERMEKIIESIISDRRLPARAKEKCTVQR